jgi:hypothetical protein
LIVTVNGELVWSRLFRPEDDVRELTRMADGCRVDFERVGWVHDVRRQDGRLSGRMTWTPWVNSPETSGSHSIPIRH